MVPGLEIDTLILPPGPAQMSPSIPGLGPVKSILPPPSWTMVQASRTGPPVPKIGLMHVVPPVIGGWVHTPPTQMSLVQMSPSSVHGVLSGRFTSGGQVPLVPVQFSGGAQKPVEERHTSVLGRKVSAGQAPLVPVQSSGGSQKPVESRHTVEADENVTTVHRAAAV